MRVIERVCSARSRSLERQTLLPPQRRHVLRRQLGIGPAPHRFDAIREAQEPGLLGAVKVLDGRALHVVGVASRVLGEHTSCAFEKLEVNRPGT